MERKEQTKKIEEAAMAIKRYCKCGCGEELALHYYNKYYIPKYVPGHCGQSLTKEDIQKREEKLAVLNAKKRYCKCGCGEELNTVKLNIACQQKIPEYINGHSTKGKSGDEFYSKERREKLSKQRAGIIVTHETINKLKEQRKFRVLPTKDTTIEVKIQKFLSELQIEYYTHKYINIEHGYQCDILIPSINTIIECDGDYWHKYPIGNDIDHIRTKELTEKGFRVIRLWERDIRIMKIEDFKNIIK